MERKDHVFDGLIAAAATHFAAGRLAEAAAGYRAALERQPGNPVVLHNLGVITASQGDDRAAIALFDAALSAAPNYAAARYNRAAALAAIGDRRAAIGGFLETLRGDPENYAAHRALAFCLLAEGERDRALDHFARTYELRRGEDASGTDAASLAQATRTKLRHDAEQFQHLALRDRNSARFEALARSYEAVARDFPVEVTPLSPANVAMLGAGYNRAITIRDAPEILGGAIAPRDDKDELLRRFESGKGRAVAIDRLLTPPALASLRRYLLESTIWHDFSHIEGFVASYLEDGLASPLMLQIADELRRAFPELLADHPLSQAWAFKAVSPVGAVDLHSDDAALSVNFWVTPSAANRDPGRGGLVVCLAPPPAAWRPTDYAADKVRAVPFLEQHRDAALVVPYAENRAVLFESRLLHYSDAPSFAEAYESHRINVTLLFGQGPGAR